MYHATKKEQPLPLQNRVFLIKLPAFTTQMIEYVMQISFDTPTPQAPTSQDLTLTESAAKQILAVISKKENGAALKLRLKIHGGGCNGYSYSFSLTDTLNDDDISFMCDGISGATVIVDPTSLTFVAGSTIDYINTLETAQFVVNNPNATTSCGCGNSFGL